MATLNVLSAQWQGESMIKGIGFIFIFLVSLVLSGCSGGWESQNSYTGSTYAARRSPPVSENGGTSTRRAMESRLRQLFSAYRMSITKWKRLEALRFYSFLPHGVVFARMCCRSSTSLRAGRVRRGWQVYGIMVGEGVTQARGYVDQYRPNFPVLLDQQNSIAGRYGVRGYPTFVIVNGNGTVQYNANALPRNF
jgi:AhpC/TSA family.